jgi:hypothetical protein
VADLPPLASDAQRSVLLDALQNGRVKVMGKAFRCLTGQWRMTTDNFVDAIHRHLKSGGRVFQKFGQGDVGLLANKLQASVWIRDPEIDDEYDDGTVYVELVITADEVILIFNAHEHEAGIRRLPI